MLRKLPCPASKWDKLRGCEPVTVNDKVINTGKYSYRHIEVGKAFIEDFYSL